MINYTTLKLFLALQVYKHCFSTLWIYTTLKRLEHLWNMQIVLVPYEFTLLSNPCKVLYVLKIVLVPYEFTLLSNGRSLADRYAIVLVPYEFTLL